MEQVVIQVDPLAGLTKAASFGERLSIVHSELLRRCPGAGRLAVALHDGKTGMLKTFAASPSDQNPLVNYEASIEDVRSLRDVAASGCARVVHDLAALNGTHPHSQQIRGHGFVSSYTLPIFSNCMLIGFVFCDSVQKGYFRNGVVNQVELFAQIVAQLVLREQASLATLNAALKENGFYGRIRSTEHEAIAQIGGSARHNDALYVSLQAQVTCTRTRAGTRARCAPGRRQLRTTDRLWRWGVEVAEPKAVAVVGTRSASRSVAMATLLKDCIERHGWAERLCVTVGGLGAGAGRADAIELGMLERDGFEPMSAGCVDVGEDPSVLAAADCLVVASAEDAALFLEWPEADGSLIGSPS